MAPARSRSLLSALPPIAAIVGLAVLVVAAVVFQGSEGSAYDFRAYDDAARRLLAGEPVYLPGTAEAYRAGEYEGLYLYPPQVAVGFVPLAALPPDLAVAAWFGLRVGLLLLGSALLPVAVSIRLATFAVAAVSFPVLFDLNLGNISVVVFAMTAAAWRLQDGWLAAILHAVLAMLRIPFGAFGILWLAQRRWQMVARAGVAGLLIVALTAPLVGVDAYVEYLGILTTLPDVTVGEHNFSLKSMALDLGLGPGAGTVALVVGIVLGVAAIIYAGLRRDRDTAFVVTAVATLLTAPFLHPHYLVILLIPAAFLAERVSPVALAIPLAGWLPGPVLPAVAVVVLVLVLLPAVARRGGDPARALRTAHSPAPA